EFSDSEMREALDACHWKSYRKDDVIVREGAEDHAFFILAEGEVEVSILGKPVEILRRGDCFGEMNYLSKSRRTATVTAREDIHVLKTHAERIERTSTACQLRFSKVLTKILLSRLTETTDRMAQLAK
ncbi:MAG TPA: cyclic nucleotide-binding domain-containing protein, partial [Gammaproteobacteria bacterium]|nr:cyclic nucleotide-binding domain-containing protein [Gammaproteobacteria bacterium]